MKITVDDKSIMRAFRDIDLSKNDLLDIEKPGAMVLVSGMRIRVAVDTADTQNSIGQHIETANEETVVDEVGPETNYAPNIEYGRRDQPNYPAQPFVRPTAEQDYSATVNAINNAFADKVKNKWPK